MHDMEGVFTTENRVAPNGPLQTICRPREGLADGGIHTDLWLCLTTLPLRLLASCARASRGPCIQRVP
jgi:hypothetical protein